MSPNATACSPFDIAHPADVVLDPLSFVDGKPSIVFDDGVITNHDGTLQLVAGPSIFSLQIPLGVGSSLNLKITGATIKADVVQVGDAIVLQNGQLGGVLDSKTADTIRGLKIDQIGLKPADSLLDATFANILGPLLALPKAKKSITDKYNGCRTPDIDVDGDGLEAYCDSCYAPTPDQAVNCPTDMTGQPVDPKTVDICIDGDGTEVKDVVDATGAVIMQCSEAMKGDKYRFVDGISVELNFQTIPLHSIKPPA